MREDPKTAIIKNWFVKADEALADAKLTLELNRLTATQNRLYYAIFYAVSALAQKHGFVSSNHVQLQDWFNNELYKTGKVHIKFSKLYKKCYNDKQKNDYTFTFKPQKEDLKAETKEVEEFIKVLKQLSEK
jgi:uncharacterized protein